MSRCSSGFVIALVVCATGCNALFGLIHVSSGSDAASVGGDGSDAAPATTLAQQAYIKASNTNADDFFGFAIAISADGDTLVVGARDEDSAATGINGNQADNSVMDAGAAYVFTRSGTTWSQQAYLKASTAHMVGDWFGSSVALSSDGDTLVVGASSDDGSSLPNAGAAYVFVRASNTWSQQARITASNAGVSDMFGSSVAISGDGATICVGAPFEDSDGTGISTAELDNSDTDSGAAYVFVRNGATWTQSAYVKAFNTEAGDWFGYSMALSNDGNTLAIGALYEDGAATGVNGDQTNHTAFHAGAVYTYMRAGNLWSTDAYIKASNTEADDEFGYSIALSGDGNTLGVGAYNESSAATGIDGNQADNSAMNSGAAYLFGRSGTTWSQTAYVKASNTDTADGFGAHMALSPDATMFAVGAPGEDSAATGVDGDQTDNTAANSGAIYVFGTANGAWRQTAYVKASNTDAGDELATPVLATTTLAASALGEASAATGIDGDQTSNAAPDSGAVYVFQ